MNYCNKPRLLFMLSRFTFDSLIANALFVLILSANPISAFADINSARLAMEDTTNPLLLFGTSRGDIYVEMFPQESPNNVQHFIALAAGEIEILDPALNNSFRPRYFDGMRFHRVIPGFIVQAGSPAYHSLGAPSAVLADEINADALGLNQLKVLNPDGSFNSMLNITSKNDFDSEILQPLYRGLGITGIDALESRQDEVLQALQQMTVKQVYENQGFRYRTGFQSRPIVRGIVALANQGPDSNGPEFFISLGDSSTLTGKYTVIGKVVEGMEIVDAIGELAIDPMQFSRQSTVIYSVTSIE